MVKEGFISTYRNKIMSLASVSIVTASLIIFGIFLLIIFNLSYNLESLARQPELEVFCRPDLSDEQVKVVEQSIKDNGKVAQYTTVTKEEAMEKAKKIMGENARLLEGEDSSFMNVSFIIKVKELEYYEQVIDQYKRLSEVENVQYYMDTIKLITKITYWVKVISIVLLAVLLIVSIMIISNTIKLTLFARRKEINIMKYIGATDWFIRWPFIIEGVIIGVLGAVVAFILVGYGYNLIGNKFNYDLLSMGTQNFKVLGLSEVGSSVALIYASIGAVVGALGSSISIHKYLKV